ncbi:MULTISPECIES: TonB-dependent receptor [unclassified Leeuwenhoekiella]|uniref:SusC/RagA family TonB-linked outer membrane protein n=1 Tax=unclassified Leeuwenhoekiella TaxID=2615029 RepID=UPI000C699C5C|nr:MULTISPECIES: TonB-dependent receptor [unclassified Leeuwenhoekiella]MAW93739.1 SusC/RagA family TonB-linked outer membrane protein [Leeuwenhoekiella sp.]MBA83038.1 SusC/RagA family TonB-linked outer membrane protein [Leeuwenhoekiella sp.]|tara:strand:+ start:20003 stop:23194 length:3192 start_codon:yes stop_codon:yes gene_type:complete
MKIPLIKTAHVSKTLILGILFPLFAATAEERSNAYTTYETKISEQQVAVSGTVVSAEDGLPLPGVNVIVKGQTGMGAVTDFDGKYTINVPSSESVLIFSFVGFKTAERKVGSNTTIDLQMATDENSLEEVVVVGYGQQKKESVVAAIVQASGEDLERAGNVPNIGSALAGNVPGVITTSSTGLPGAEDPRIFIRGLSTFNGGEPLILVDGIERPMNTVAISSVESISVLKDASATAVYGVRGANGVILITTKRGKSGRAVLRARLNTTVKTASKLPGKKDSYDTFLVRNQAIENELSIRPESWGAYMSQDIIDKYRFPANLAESERYPNVDWDEALFKDFAPSYNANLNISGGSEFVKYFAGADFQYEGDLIRQYNNSRGYQPGFNYNRFNVRTNLDFQLTPSTVLKVGLSGSYGVRKTPWGFNGGQYVYWIAAYSTPPDIYLPQYSDGTWGYDAPSGGGEGNAIRNLAISGVQYLTTTQLQTNFTLEQKLDVIAKGLTFNGTIALDNTFIEANRGVNDLFNDPQEKWIDPLTGIETYRRTYDANTGFDYAQGVRWTAQGGGVNDGASYRRLFYQTQLNYTTTIEDKHDVTAMGLFNRNEFATGSILPFYREDWVFRATYGYDNRYLIEYNGAYNGSEKFAADKRFAFFSSGGIGWNIMNESFMDKADFINNLKLRASYGQIGDDNIGARFLYLTAWGYGGQSRLGVTGEQAEASPYVWYRETQVGNPGVSWESVKKTNIGLDYGFFNNAISGSIDYFSDDRIDVLVSGGDRAIPDYYGTEAPVANLGRVKNEGYELVLNLNHNFTPDLRVWADLNMTHAENVTIDRDDAELTPNYQKDEGYAINQARTFIDNGFYNTWDELYGSTQHNTNDSQKLPGGYQIIDFNGDGVIDDFDQTPYGFAGAPQNTYNATVGFDWKGLSAFVQFFGANNVTRQVVFNSLGNQNNIVYDEGSYWSKDNTNADAPVPRWVSTPNGASNGSRFFYDASYVRLKNAEIAYTFTADSKLLKTFGFDSLRLFLNGNNLYVWTKMPDDRESNFAGTGWASQGAYPTVKRFNFGLNITF